jgi:flagellar biosynthesis protein FliR
MTVTILPEMAALFMLVFARVGTMVMLMPGLGERFVLNRAKLAIAVFLALLLMPVARPLMQVPTDPGILMSLLISEILIGAVLGLSARLIMAALADSRRDHRQPDRPRFRDGGRSQHGAAEPIDRQLPDHPRDHHGAGHGPAPSCHQRRSTTAIRCCRPAHIRRWGTPRARVFRRSASLFDRGADVGAVHRVRTAVQSGLGVLARLMPQFQVFFLGAPASILIGMAILAA